MTRPHHVGGDLVWWRESAGLHTLVTLWPGVEDVGRFGPSGLREAPLELRLYDAGGRFRRSWRDTIRAGVPFTIDSARLDADGDDGVLLVSALANDGVTRRRRLQSMVDWYSDGGAVVSLHSDHAVWERQSPIELTEIVFVESEASANSLVFVNGPAPQRAKALELVARNHRGERRRATYDSPMAPFSVHRPRLAEIFPGLDAFCEGRHATLEGRFDAAGVFSRPYVITDGRHPGGYHGGDRYEWNGLPQFVHRALGRGETNPMVAVHSSSLTTTVNLLNSHGELDDDFWVDARLYDRTGALVADRPRWRLATRGGLARGDIAELLDGRREFAGHISLSFASGDAAFYPRRLQALMEYRTPASTARVMAWSDIWNARETVRRLRDRLAGMFDVRALYGDEYLEGIGLTYRCHYRVWSRAPLTSFVAITNCGAAERYESTIAYTIRLFNGAGEQLATSGALAPNATLYEPIDRLFPAAAEFLAPAGVGVVTVESAADLAVMHFTRNERSDVVSAEHFLPSINRRDGVAYSCCGS